jgi:molybdenum ABC transporter, periplasmic molybdate-binding protein
MRRRLRAQMTPKDAVSAGTRRQVGERFAVQMQHAHSRISPVGTPWRCSPMKRASRPLDHVAASWRAATGKGLRITVNGLSILALSTPAFLGPLAASAHAAGDIVNGADRAASAPHTLTLSAAISVSEAMKQLAAGYEARHPGSTILLNVGSSGALLQQVEKGAPVDILATADEATMDRAQEKGLIRPGSRQVFAFNTLVLIQPAQARTPLTRLEDLQKPAIRRIAIGNPDTVPAGRYAEQALRDAGVWAPLQEKIIPAQNVRQVVEYVARGEVDAGFVYGSDVAVLRGRGSVALTLDIKASYAVAVLRNSQEPRYAEDFLAWMLSSEGQTLLAHQGFMTRSPINLEAREPVPDAMQSQTPPPAARPPVNVPARD